MKNPQILLLSIFTIILLLNGSIAQTVDTPVVFNLSEQHEMTVVVEGSLTWNDGETEQIIVNATMSDFEFNNSQIQIITIGFIIVDASSGQQFPQTNNNTQVELTANSPTVSYSPVFDVPEQTDRFHINITMLAIPQGGGVEQTQEFYSLRFPQDGSIIVTRDNIVPAVNLYGFPQGSFFGLWVPVYGIFILLLLTPALIVGVNQLYQRRAESGGSTLTKEETKEEDDNE